MMTAAVLGSMAMAVTIVKQQLGPRARFSLGDILFFMFGLSVGLAYWRWSKNPWPTALLAAFVTWLVMGLARRLGSDLARARRHILIGEPAEAQLVRAGLSAASLLLLAVVAASELTFRHYAAAGTLREHACVFYLHEVADVLFYLAIMAAFWIPVRAVATNSKLRSGLRLVLDLVLIGVAAYWATKALSNIVVILQLVHIAISGVINAQPTRWAGHPLTSFHLHAPPLESQWAALLAVFSALVLAAALGALLTLSFTRRTVPRALTLIAFAAASATAGYLLADVWERGLVQLSPFFAEAFQEMAIQAWPAAAILIITFGAALALGVSVTAAPAPCEAPIAAQPLAFRLPALLMFMAAIACEIGRQLYEFAATYATTFAPISPFVSLWLACTYASHTLAEFLMNWPIRMVAPAALLVVARYGWWTWKGRDISGHTWTVRPGQFFVLWLASCIVLALLVPFAVCWALMMAIGSIPSG